MMQLWRSLSLFGVAGVLFACALVPSRFLLADGPSAVGGASSAESKPTIRSKPDEVTKSDAAGKNGSHAKPSAAARAERSAGSAKVHAATTKLTPEREAAAVAFAGQNHPELATLLNNLKQNNPSEYHAAVVELDRIVERLASLKLKNVAQHDLELAHWQRDSRIRLMAARLTMSDNPALEAELKAAVREKAEATLAERKVERDRLQRRVEKLDQSIGELTTKLDELAEKEFAALKRSAQSSKSVGKSRPFKKSDVNVIAKPVERSTTNQDKGGAKPAPKESTGK